MAAAEFATCAKPAPARFAHVADAHARRAAGEQLPGEIARRHDQGAEERRASVRGKRREAREARRASDRQVWADGPQWTHNDQTCRGMRVA